MYLPLQKYMVNEFSGNVSFGSGFWCIGRLLDGSLAGNCQSDLASPVLCKRRSLNALIYLANGTLNVWSY